MATLENQIQKIEDDIKTITIQGATNVALATLEGIRLVALNTSDIDQLLRSVKDVGERLSNARENEPLARNAVTYIFSQLDAQENKEGSFQEVIIDLIKQYEAFIAEGKKQIVIHGTEALKEEEVVLTHCHSSTATKILMNTAALRKAEGQNFQVVSTETRPLYQGRKTAKELVEAGIDVTQIVDSACASFIVDDQYLPVGAIVVGCDELLRDGSFINKVGTYSMALSAQKGKDEFYVATHLLKMDPERPIDIPKIEQRKASEVWKEAPSELNIINPAFEHVPANLVTGYITEAGILTNEQLLPKARELYPWLTQ